MTAMVTSAIRMQHAIDPKQAIWNDVGEFVKQVSLVNPYEIMLASYERAAAGEARTKGGIIIPETAADEDKFQGIVGLVIKVGELAFTGDDNHRWGSRVPQVNDWVTFRVGDTHPFTVGKRMVRLISDASVRLILDGDPSEVI